MEPVRKTRDHRPWMMMLERRCCAQDLVSLKWYCNSILISIRLCVPSCPYHPRNKGLLGRGPHITSGHIHIPPLTSLSHEFLNFLVRMEESAAAAALPDNIILKLPELSALHLRIHAPERRDWTFSIYTSPLGI